MKDNFRILTLCLTLTLLLFSCSFGDKPSDGTESESLTGEAQTEPITQETPKTGKYELSVTWHDGYVGSSSNTEYPNKIKDMPGTKYSYTDVITVPKAGTRITFSDNGGTYASDSVYVISSWKNVNGTWKIDLNGSNYAGSLSKQSDILTRIDNQPTYVYVTSVDSENLRLCYRSEQTASFIPNFPKVYAEQTDEKGTDYQSVSTRQWIERQRQMQNFSSLEGLTINAIGDSYFAGNGLESEYLWLTLLGRKYSINMNNYGINGATIATTGHHSMCTRYRNMPDNNPDIVLVEGGRNDFNKNTALGSVDSTDTATFMGALNVVLSGLKAKYPSAVIICLTNWNYGGKNNIGLKSSDYANAMKQVAEKYGVFCFEANNPSVSGIDMTDSSFRETYCMTPGDISHLNQKGMRKFMQVIEKYIAQCYESAK